MSWLSVCVPFVYIPTSFAFEYVGCVCPLNTLAFEHIMLFVCGTLQTKGRKISLYISDFFFFLVSKNLTLDFEG